MATVYSIGYSRYNAGKKVLPGQWKPDCCMDQYEASSLESGSTIYMFIPPNGARVKGGYVISDALGTGVTLKVGIPDATDKFLAATSHASATKSALLPAAAIDAVGYEFDGETPVVITTGGGAATGTIILVMEFYGTCL